MKINHNFFDSNTHEEEMRETKDQRRVSEKAQRQLKVATFVGAVALDSETTVNTAQEPKEEKAA